MDADTEVAVDPDGGGDVDRVCFVSLPLYGFFNQEVYGQTGGGGAKRQLALLSEQLRERFEMHAVVGDYGQPRRERRDGVTFHRAYTPDGPSTPVKFYRLLAAMRRADADVYLHRGHPRMAAAVSVAATLLGRAWVYNVSNDSNLRVNYDRCPASVRWLFRRGLANAHAVIAQTEHQQQVLSERFDTASIVIPNGYPLDRPATDDHSDDTSSSRNHSGTARDGPDNSGRQTATPDNEFLLWVGRIEQEQKRPDILLDCAERLPEQEFVLVGPREDREYAEQIAKRCRSLPNAEYVGPVAPNDIYRFYAGALTLINTSAYEGFPNTFLEAWRQGVPVVSLDVDPGRYLDETCFTGYADGSVDTLVSQLQRLATDADYRRRVGDELQDYFERQYQIDVIAERYGAVLAEGAVPQR